MEKENPISNIFKIDPKVQDNIIEYIKKQWKFLFGFFCGVMVIVLLN